jgi:hypothetical protein
MVEFMHKEVLRVTKVTMGAAHNVAFIYDEVSIVDNQSWLSMHCYVMHN